MHNLTFYQFHNELNEWYKINKNPIFWLRDDDLGSDQTSFYRLINLTNKYSIPAHIAMIPFGHRGIDNTRIKDLPETVLIWVHGYKHCNRSQFQRRSEYPVSLSEEIILKEIKKSKIKLTHCFPKNFSPVFVPPWNALDESLLPIFFQAGYKCISTLRQYHSQYDTQIKIDIDLMNWKKGRIFSLHQILSSISNELFTRRIKKIWQLPIGIMSHCIFYKDYDWLVFDNLLKILQSYIWLHHRV